MSAIDSYLLAYAKIEDPHVSLEVFLSEARIYATDYDALNARVQKTAGEALKVTKIPLEKLAHNVTLDPELENDLHEFSLRILREVQKRETLHEFISSPDFLGAMQEHCVIL